MTAAAAATTRPGPNRQPHDEHNGAVVIGVLGFVTMLVLGMAYAELGLGAPLGFWPSVGLALPVAAVINALKDRGKEFSDAFSNTAFSLGWSLMICVGILHHEFDLIRPLGFWPCLGLSLPIAVVLATIQEHPNLRKFPSNIVFGTIGAGWALMLAAGVAFHEFGVGQPVGFWPCAAVGFGVMALLDQFLPEKSDQPLPAKSC